MVRDDCKNKFCVEAKACMEIINDSSACIAGEQRKKADELVALCAREKEAKRAKNRRKRGKR